MIRPADACGFCVAEAAGEEAVIEVDEVQLALMLAEVRRVTRVKVFEMLSARGRRGRRDPEGEAERAGDVLVAEFRGAPSGLAPRTERRVKALLAAAGVVAGRVRD